MATITVEQALQTARAFQQAGQTAAAETLYRQILAADPGLAEAWHALGTICLLTGRRAEAVPCLLRAAESAPANATYHSDLGVAYRQSERTEEAVASFRRAAALLPDAPAIHLDLGEALAALGQFEEAIPFYEQAAALKPGFAEAHSNLGRALMQTGRLDEAIASCRRAIAVRPDLPEAHLNLGAALLRNRMFLPAIDAFRQAIALRPDFSEAHQTLSFVLLLLGRYAEGWKEHEWRWQCPIWSRRWQPFVAPRWDGRPAPGATIWLHVEQGFGDAIQFLRYIPFVREWSGAEVVLFCTPRLGRLFSLDGNCPATVVVQETLDGASLPARDRHLPILSLPAALGLYEPVPMAGPYLRADPKLQTLWRERLRTASGLRVGLAWFGNPANQENRRRSLPAAQLNPLLEMPGVTFVNLQIDPCGGAPGVRDGRSQWIDPAAQITDFADTAAIMAELDLIITTDTATAHLAGALGRPVWTLLHWVADWRWGLEREDTPWYPTMRLFRQPNAGDWDSVLQHVAKELRLRCSQRESAGLSHAP